MEHRHTGAVFALKIVRADALKPGALERASREVSVQQRAAQASPYVANVHVWGQAGATFLWFAMDYCSGGDLRQRVVRAEGVADRPWMLRATREILEGLCAMHARGITHLDLKPENVMRQPDGVLRLIDYGAAATFAAGRLDEAWVEETGGTEAFRAPERLDSVYDDEDEVWDEEGRINGPAADVYSLGVCCFLALTGTDPFDFDGGEDNEDGSFCLVDSYAGMLERLEAGDVFNATSTEGFHIPPRAGTGVSAAAKAFVVSAMRAHPSERPTAAQLEAHAWLRPGGALNMAALGAALPG